MPNLTDTRYKIYGDSSDIKKILDTINSAKYLSESEILRELKASEENLKTHILTGYLYDWYKETDECLCLYTTEEWGITDFSILLKKLMPDLEIYYMVEEPGMGLYLTNDVHNDIFGIKCRVEITINENTEVNYFRTEEEALEFISSTFNTAINSRKDVRDLNKSLPDDDSVELDIFEYYNLEYEDLYL